MLGGRTVRELYELKGKGRSIRGIADDLGISRATVRKYVRSPELPKPKPRAKRGSKLDAYKEYIDVRLAEGPENCVVLLREIRELGYDGGYSTLKNYVYPRRRPRQPKATMRFETGPGEQAQVDWGVVSYEGEDGRRHRMWVFVMVLGLLSCDLRGVRTSRGRPDVHPVSPERIRLLRRSAETLPVRQRQGGGARA